MEQYENHTIKFQDQEPQKFEPAEGISSDGTKVDVVNDPASTLQQRARDLKPPWAAAEPTPAQVNWTLLHRQKVEEMRDDPGYQFIMKVSAFANRGMRSMTMVPGGGGKRGAIPEPLSNAYTGPVPPANDDDRDNWHQSADQYKWMSAPEVSGVVHVSAALYGHIKEAQDILERVTGQRVVLKGLVEGPLSTLFARLVALRLHLSQFLSGVNYQLDATYRRLHREQHMVLRSFRCELQQGSVRVSYGIWLKDHAHRNRGWVNGTKHKLAYQGLY